MDRKTEVNLIDKAILDFSSAINTKNFEDLSQKTILTPTAYFDRGKCFSKQNKYKSALEDFNKSLELDESNSSVYYERALAKAGLNDFTGIYERLFIIC